MMSRGTLAMWALVALSIATAANAMIFSNYFAKYEVALVYLSPLCPHHYIPHQQTTCIILHHTVFNEYHFFLIFF